MSLMSGVKLAALPPRRVLLMASVEVWSVVVRSLMQWRVTVVLLVAQKEQNADWWGTGTVTRAFTPVTTKQVWKFL